MVEERMINIETIDIRMFTELVAMEVASKLGKGFDVVTDRVMERNDQEMYIVSAFKEGEHIALSFNTNEAYDFCLVNNDNTDVNSSIRNLACQIVRYVLENFKNPVSVSGTRWTASPDFVLNKDDLSVMILDMELNRKYLKDHPYKEIGAGLALVIMASIDHHEITINNETVKKYDRESLFRTALNNMAKKKPAVLCRMDRPSVNGFNMGFINEPHVLTVMEKEASGAAAIAYEGMAEKIAELAGGSYWLLPASMYAWIVVPENAGINVNEYKKRTADEMNTTVLDKTEILSWDIFYYDANERRIKRE